MTEERRTILEKWIKLNATNKVPKIVIPECLDDKDFVMEALQSLNLNFPLLQDVSPTLKKDPDVVILAIDKFPGNIGYQDKILYENKEVVLKIIETKPQNIQYASDILKDDKEVVLKAVSLDGSCLKYASNKLKADRDVVITAIKNHPLSMMYADQKYHDDKEVAMVNPACLACGWLSPRLTNDRELVLAAVESSPESYRFVSDELKKDKETLIVALNNYEKTIPFCNPKEEKKDFNDVIYRKDMADLFPYTYASDEIKADKDVGVAAVKHVDYAYRYIVPELQKDKDVFFAAFKKNRFAIEFAPKEILDDVDLMREVVLFDKSYSHYLPFALKDDKEYMMSLIEEYPNAYSDVSSRLKVDQDVVLLVAHKDFSLLSTLAKVSKKDDQYILHFYFDAKQYKLSASLVGAFSSFAGNKEFQKDVTNTSKKLKTDSEIGDVSFDLVVDEDVAIQAAKARCCDKEILKDKQFVIKLVSSMDDISSVYKTLPDGLMKDRDVALAAVKKSGANLYRFADTFKNDKEIVLIALKDKGPMKC